MPATAIASVSRFLSGWGGSSTASGQPDWFRNRAEEERRLLEAATKAVRNGASYDPLSVRDSADTSANQKIDTENAAA